MDKLANYRQTIERVLTEYAEIPYSYADLKSHVIVSRDANHYLLMTLGWERDVKVHACIVHIEISNDKIWIHRDGLEDGIALDLVAAGIPKHDIVLAFHPPEIRPYTEFAVS